MCFLSSKAHNGADLITVSVFGRLGPESRVGRAVGMPKISATDCAESPSVSRPFINIGRPYTFFAGSPQRRTRSSSTSTESRTCFDIRANGTSTEPLFGQVSMDRRGIRTRKRTFFHCDRVADERARSQSNIHIWDVQFTYDANRPVYFTSTERGHPSVKHLLLTNPDDTKRVQR